VAFGFLRRGAELGFFALADYYDDDDDLAHVT
jgi:hypothetical protein